MERCVCLRLHGARPSERGECAAVRRGRGGTPARDLSTFETLYGIVVQMFGANSEDIKTAAAFALGRCRIVWCACDTSRRTADQARTSVQGGVSVLV